MHEKPAQKIAVVLEQSLTPGIALNTTAHMGIQLGGLAEGLMGVSPVDASGDKHSGIPIYPNVVLKATGEQIKEILEKSRNYDVVVADYPKAGFETSTDEEFCVSVAQETRESIVYWGITIFGDRKAVDKLTGHLKLWK
jgi:hypothetical protein